MLDRVHWNEEPKAKRRLQTEITFRVQLGEGTDGNVFEQALHTLFPRKFTREDARFLLSQMVNAASKAILKNRCAVFPLNVVMLRGDGRNVTVIERQEELA